MNTDKNSKLQIPNHKQYTITKITMTETKKAKMNKKQLIVAWVTSIAMILVIIKGGFEYWNNPIVGLTGWHFTDKSEIRIILSLIILGGLLFYTLRDKNKK